MYRCTYCHSMVDRLDKICPECGHPLKKVNIIRIERDELGQEEWIQNPLIRLFVQALSVFLMFVLLKIFFIDSASGTSILQSARQFLHPPQSLDDRALEAYEDQNYPEALKLYNQSCQNGSVHGCNALASMVAKGEGIRQDYHQAAHLWRYSCDHNNMEGCYQLAQSYQEGWGVERDDEKAKELYGRVCDAHDQRGCSGYAKLNTLNTLVSH